MPGGNTGIAALLDVSRRALAAQTQAIRVTGSNIANVNTPGYSRRQVELVSLQPSSLTDAAAVGTGVDVNRVVRKVDAFVNSEYLTRINDSAQFQIKDEILTRAEQPFNLDNTTSTIGATLSQFFSALDDLAVSPSDIPLRTRVVDQGKALTDSIQSTFKILSGLQRETDNRIGVLVSDVNRITSQIATLNGEIGSSERGNQENLTLRDQRDQLLRELSGKIGVSTIETSDGSVNVTLANGFGLVAGSSSRTIEFVNNPSFEPSGGYPKGLDNSELGHIVFNFGDSTTRADIDLTNYIAADGGEIAGLLAVRGIQADTDTSPFDAQGELVDVASRVEALARDLLTRFNQSYLGPDEDGGTAGHQASSGDLNGNTPGVYGLFTFNGATDTDGNGLPDDLATNPINTYASEIRFNITSARDLAAALDLDATAGATTFAPGDNSNIAALSALRNQSVAYSVGNFSGNFTAEELYQTTASFVGGLKNTASNERFVAEDRETQIRELQASISGVSLDEEFANLINFQRAFEASARIIRVGDDLLGKILELLG